MFLEFFKIISRLLGILSCTFDEKSNSLDNNLLDIKKNDQTDSLNNVICSFLNKSQIDENFKDKILQCQRSYDIKFTDKEIYYLISYGIFKLDSTGNILRSMCTQFIEEDMNNKVLKVYLKKIKENFSQNSKETELQKEINKILENENFELSDELRFKIYEYAYENFKEKNETFLFEESLNNFIESCTENFLFRLFIDKHIFLDASTPVNHESNRVLFVLTKDKLNYSGHDFIVACQDKKLRMRCNYMKYNFKNKKINFRSSDIVIILKNPIKKESLDSEKMIYILIDLIYTFLKFSSDCKPIHWHYKLNYKKGIREIFSINSDFFVEEIVIKNHQVIMTCEFYKKSGKITFSQNKKNSCKNGDFYESMLLYRIPRRDFFEKIPKKYFLNDKELYDLEKLKISLSILLDAISNKESFCDSRSLNLQNIPDSSILSSSNVDIFNLEPDFSRFIQLYDTESILLSGPILNLDLKGKNTIKGFIFGVFKHLEINDKEEIKYLKNIDYLHNSNLIKKIVLKGNLQLSSKNIDLNISNFIFIKNKKFNKNVDSISILSIHESNMLIKNCITHIYETRKQNWNKIIIEKCIIRSFRSENICLFFGRNVKLEFENVRFEVSSVIISLEIGSLYFKNFYCKKIYLGIYCVDLHFRYSQKIEFIDHCGRIFIFDTILESDDFSNFDIYGCCFKYEFSQCIIGNYNIIGILNIPIRNYMEITGCTFDSNLEISVLSFIKEFSIDKSMGTIKKSKIFQIELEEIKFWQSSVFEVKFLQTDHISHLVLKNLEFSKIPLTFLLLNIDKLLLENCYYIEDGIKKVLNENQIKPQINIEIDEQTSIEKKNYYFRNLKIKIMNFIRR